VCVCVCVCVYIRANPLLLSSNRLLLCSVRLAAHIALGPQDTLKTYLFSYGFFLFFSLLCTAHVALGPPDHLNPSLRLFFFIVFLLLCSVRLAAHLPRDAQDSLKTYSLFLSCSSSSSSSFVQFNYQPTSRPKVFLPSHTNAFLATP